MEQQERALMTTATMTIVRNPFEPKKDRCVRQIVPGVTIGNALAEYGVTAEAKDLVVAVNGRAVNDHSLVVKSGDWLTVAPRIHGGGGGGGKNILMVVASIALMVVSMGVSSLVAGGSFLVGSAGFIAPALFTGAWLAGMAVMALGGLLLSSMAPQPQLDLGEFGSGDWTKTQTYGWGKMKSLQGQGYAIPITFGNVWTAGHVLASHVSTDGDKQYLNILLCGGEGPLDYMDSLETDGNPIANYEGVSVEYRLGTNDQTVISNFADTYADQALSYDLVVGNPAVQQTEGSGGEGLEVTVELPGGLYYGNDQGGLSEATVNVKAEYRIVGAASYTLWGNWAITAASNGAIRRVYRLDGLAAGQYEVQLTCTSKSGTTSRYSTRIYWTQLTHIIYDDFSLPNLALIGVKALATDQLSGSMPEMKWRQGRLNVWVWNPNISAYEERPANLPAWACYDLSHYARRLKDVRTGQWVFVVKGRQSSRLDYAGFLAWAAMNAAKSLTFHHYYEQASDFWSAMKLPETVGRGKVIPKGTTYSPIWDDAKQPVQLFSVGNTSNFKRKFLPMKDRANAVEVSFFDRDRKGERRTITITSDNYASETPNHTQITLYGVDNFAQAWREGKYKLRLNQYLTETVVWNAHYDAISCQDGDLVLIQNDVPEWGYGGRLVGVERVIDEELSTTTDVVTIDRKVTMEPGTTYEIMIRYSNIVDESSGQPRDKFITAIVAPVDEITETDTFTMSELFDVLPDALDVYSFGRQNLSTKPFVVMRITRSSDQAMTLSGLEYVEAIYTEADDVPEIEYSAVSGSVSASANMRIDENGLVWVDVAWYPSRDVYYGATISVDGVKKYSAGPHESSWSFEVKLPSSYRIKIDVTDVFKNIIANASVSIEIPTMFPASVPSLSISPLGPEILLTWPVVEAASAPIQGYEIRRGETWSTGQLAAKLTGRNTNNVKLSAMRGTHKYWVCAYNQYGYSAIPAGDSISMNVVPMRNFVDEKKAYEETGTISGNGTRFSGLIVQGSELTYGTIKTMTWAQLKTTRLLGPTAGTVTVEGDVVDIGKPADVLLTVVESWLRAPDVATIWEYKASADNNTWSEWSPLPLGKAFGQYFKLRMTIGGINQCGILEDATVVIDVPDQDLAFIGVDVPVGGVDVVFDPPYVNKPAVLVTPDGAALTPKVTDIDNAGCHIELYDGPGTTEVGGKASVYTKGF